MNEEALRALACVVSRTTHTHSIHLVHIIHVNRTAVTSNTSIYESDGCRKTEREELILLNFKYSVCCAFLCSVPSSAFSLTLKSCVATYSPVDLVVLL